MKFHPIPLISGIASGAIFLVSQSQGLSLAESIGWSFVPTIALPVMWHFSRKLLPTQPSQKANRSCPDCGADAKHNFIGGPQGGMSVNVLCSKCHHEYNILPTSDDGAFIVIDDNGKPSPERLKRVYGIYSEFQGFEPVPPGKFRFEIDGRPAGPIRDDLYEAYADAVRNGYASWHEAGIKLDANAGGEINRG